MSDDEMTHLWNEFQIKRHKIQELKERYAEAKKQADELKTAFVKMGTALEEHWIMIRPYCRFKCDTCKQKFSPVRFENTTCPQCEAIKLIEKEKKNG